MPLRRARKRFAPRRKAVGGRRKTFRRKRFRAEMITRMPKTMSSVYPDKLLIKATMAVTIVSGSVSAGHVVTFKGNGLFQSGPRIDWAGSYATNVPSGIAYLISSNNSGGAAAPYNQCRITGSGVRFKIAQSASNVDALSWYCLPSVANSFSGSVTNLIEEQPYCRKGVITAIQYTKYPTFKHYMSTSRMYGVPRIMLNQDEYSCTATADPARLWYWHIGTNSLQGGVTESASLQVWVTYYYEFFNRNVYNSTVPS